MSLGQFEEEEVIRWLRACQQPFGYPTPDHPAAQRLQRQLSILYDKGLIEPGPTAILAPDPEQFST